jgi:hypothetical protein
MIPRLEGAGLVVAAPFDYREFTGPSSFSIEELARLFGDHVEQVRQAHKTAQVDVVAHSMGGLIARAWMTGLTVPSPPPSPYAGQIRKLILVGTPNYGADLARFSGGAELIGCSEIQANQLRFGSRFVWDLHEKWEEFQENSLNAISSGNVLFIVGTRSETLGVECNPLVPLDLKLFQGCSDGVVDISSAVLPNTPAARIRYVPYRHADLLDAVTNSNPTLVGVTDENHKTHQLVREFLKSSLVMDQCCGEDTVDYEPPQFDEGLLLIRLVDALGQGINSGDGKLQLRPHTIFKQDRNEDTGAITAWGIAAPGQYNVTVKGITGYKKRTLEGMLIEAARPAVPNEI